MLTVVDSMLALMTEWLGLVVTVLAVARITRLVTTDKISEPVRVAVAQRLREGNAVAYLLHCQWCVSVWVGVPAAGLLCAGYGWALWWWLPVGLALSYTVGLLARFESV